ncbi:MAG TPA: RNA chaperone Hfq [Acidobacteriota bacterium]|nr:RNA chaperone Hfq [Acidobacteriota bacterium]HQF87706.1 RNA chaperone Hfq [Acidobacteriota bacterium]HQG93174.1 RNA chaperone Hfq [Acidobacteriota bacterium]HQK87730.1 RNA chaperone Hfq [Acidobacteriota bacterium]
MVNRKLIRPSISEMSPSTPKFHGPGYKRVPPDQTHAENFYYVKQMNNKTPMVVRLTNGEDLQGYIEWYDRDCIKFNREGAPNLLIYKTSILYMYKQGEDEGGEDSNRHPRHRRYPDRDDRTDNGLPDGNRD